MDACKKVHKKGTLKSDLRSSVQLPIMLVGFSKGCVVLNQVLHELVNYVTVDPSIAQLPPYPYSHPRHHLSTSSISSVSSISSTEDSSYLHHHPHRVNHRAASPRPPRKISPEPMHIARSSSTSSPRSGTAQSSTDLASPSSSEHPHPFYRSSSSSHGASAGSHTISLTDKEIGRVKSFLSQVKAIYWLDAGHSGGHGAWIIDDTLLKLLASLKADIQVHVSPQQVCDPHRTWIGEEEREFVDRLRYYGARVEETVHFEHDERSLEKHFRVLEVF